MSDNVAITAGTGTSIAADDVGGVLHQRVKISQGADGSATDVSSAAPLQVTLANTGANTNKILTTPDLPTGAATSTKQSDGSQKSQIVDGSGNVIGATSNALDVNIKSGASSGTQYTEADTDSTITGTAVMWEDTSDTLRSVSAAKPLPVDIKNTTIAVTQSGTWDEIGINDSGNSITVDGTVAVSNSTFPVTDNSGSLTVDNGGTFAVQVDGAALTSLQLADDVVATLGTTTYTEATTKATTIGAVRRDANTTLVDTTNEIAPLQVNATGELKVAQIQALPAGTNAIGKLAANDGVDIGDVTINNSTGGSAVNIQDGGNSITVDYATTGSGTATGALRVELPTNGTGVVGLNAGTNAIGKLTSNSGVTIGAVEIAATQTLATVTTVGTVTTLTGTTTLTPGTGAANLGKAEDAVAGTGDTGVFSLSVANEAQTTLAADADYIARAADTKGNSLMVGNIASDGVDAGNPVKIGALARSSEITAVANADRVNLIADLVGKLIVLPYANPENFVSGAITTAMTGTTSTSLIAAPASGLRNYITQITVSNSHATVGTDIIIQDGSGGTTLYTIPAAAVYGGAVLTFPTPLRQPTTATAIYCANVTTGASTKVSASGYKGA